MNRPSKITQLLFGLLAYTSLAIGLIAIVVPGLPTTEFILLAAWAATRSSPRLSAWLENHRLFGPMLHNWRNGKVIPRRAKVGATTSMLLCAGLMLVLLDRSEEHTSELQSLMRISYAVFCLKKKKHKKHTKHDITS